MSDFINAMLASFLMMDVNLLLGTEQASFYFHHYSNTLASLTVLVHVLHCSYVMKRKPFTPPCGIVTIDLGKNRLVEIPRSSCEAPDDGFTRIQLISAFACELRMRIWHACQLECNELEI